MADLKITSVKFFKYSLRLKKPFFVKGKVLTQREGFILKLENGKTVGLGEIAPLDGFSPEAFAGAQSQIKKLKDILEGEEISYDLVKLNGGFEGWLSGFKLLPSVRCGTEAAVLNLLANTSDVSLSQLFTCCAQRDILISGLLDGSPQEIIRQVKDSVSRGFRSFKIKVGRRNIAEDINLAKTVLDIIKAKASVHFDANGAWELEEAVQFADAVKGESLEYLEEPLKDKSKIPEFAKKTGVGIALDENLLTLTPNAIGKIKGLRAVTLKPMVLGGFEKAMAFVRAAQASDIQPIISSCFETSAGLTVLANFAAATMNDGIAAGLDTIKYFKEDIAPGSVSVKNGALNIKKINKNQKALRTGLFKAAS